MTAIHAALLVSLVPLVVVNAKLLPAIGGRPTRGPRFVIALFGLGIAALGAVITNGAYESSSTGDVLAFCRYCSDHFTDKQTSEFWLSIAGWYYLGTLLLSFGLLALQTAFKGTGREP
jgi:hypothetical protein